MGPRPHGDPVGNTVQPSADEVAVADRAGSADQDEERGLERVLDIALVAEHAAADAENHRTVPRDQRGERRLVAVGDVAIQERPSLRPATVPRLNRRSNWSRTAPA